MEKKKERGQSKEAEEPQIEKTNELSLDEVTPYDESSDSDDSYDDEWQWGFEERKRVTERQWEAFEAGHKLAEPHSVEWNKANFLNSRHDIEHLQRRDGKLLKSDEIHYTVAATPLSDATDLSKSSRPGLIDLGFSCSFEECENIPLRNLSASKLPELLIGMSSTHGRCIFSLGLLFWQIVMLRRLVETSYSSDDPERIYSKNRLLRDLAQRLGPIPASLCAQ